jgi:uncharacterized DUF497 family protein
MYVWDEKKREANLAKHGLDFGDAHLVFESPEKVTVQSSTTLEARTMDFVMVEAADTVLALVYVERGEDIRVISFRRASRRERMRYARAKEQN